MADDKTLELKLIAKDMLSAVVAEAQKSVGGLADAVKSGGQKVAGAWPAAVQGVRNLDEKFSTVKATASQAFGILQDGWNLLIEPGLEAARITAQTEAVIKSTGGAAGLTAEQIGEMAGAMSRVSGVSDEQAQAAENVLLRYKEIGGDTFPRVTSAVNDMAVSLAEGDVAAADLTGTAALLGKALSNPEQGLMQLERSVGKFSAAEKASIKEMMAHNDIAGAQAVILDKLEQKFGGAAKAAGDTLPGKMAKAQNAIENFQENVANVFIPIMGDAADAFNTLTTGNQQLADAFRGSQAQMQADLIAGRMTLEDYNNGIAGMAQNVMAWNAATGAALQTQYTMTQAQIDQIAAFEAAKQGAYGLNGALDESNRAARGAAEAEAVAASAADSKARADAAAAIQADLHAKAIEQQAQIARNNRAAIDDYATSLSTVAQRLKDATEAEAKQELAKAATDQLKAARDSKLISDQEYLTLLTSLQLQYGLATEKSIAMGEGQATLNQLLQTGAIDGQTYVASIGNIPAAARDGEVSLDELVTGGIDPAKLALIDAGTATGTLRDALEKLPRKIKIEIAIEQTGSIPQSLGGKGDGKALGGPVSAYNPYWVGEHGAEPFMPAVDGRILSRRDAMDALSRSGGSSAPVVNVSIAATLANQMDVEDLAWRVSEVVGKRLQSYS